MNLEQSIARLNYLGTSDPRAAGMKVPPAEEVCRVLETLYLLSAPCTPDEYEKFAHTVYEFTHIQGNPSCLHAHKNMTENFWAMLNDMKTSGEIRPKKKVIPKKKKCYT